MHSMRSWMLVVCLLFSPSLYCESEHNPLLPRPQEIRYGTGRLPLSGVAIGLGADQTPQDRFAADELASGLGSRVHVLVGLAEALGGPPMVVLRRNGSGPDPS